MSDLYDTVAKLDKAIADRWKARTKGDPKVKLRAGDVDAIMSPLVKKKGYPKITAKEADAIRKLVEETGLEKGALERITYYVQFAEDLLGLEEEPLITDAELAPFYGSLQAGIVGSIVFKSPRSNISYAGFDYLAIQELVKLRKINVVQVKIAGLAALTRAQATYTSGFDILRIYDGLAPLERTSAVIHEVTHAIQDWQDVSPLAFYTESDSFVAEGIAQHILAGQPIFHGDIPARAFDAAKFVIDGTAEASNKAWVTAYDAVVTAVSKSKTYAKLAGVRFNGVKGETTRESEQFGKLKAALEQRSRDLANWAADAWQSTLGSIPGRLSEVLP